MSNPDGVPANSGTGLAASALKDQMSRLQKALASNTKGKGGSGSVASVRGPGMMGLASVSVADVESDAKEETNGRSRRKKGSRRERDPNPWHLHKFGGTSMAKMQDVAAVVKRVLTEFVPGRTGVVVSAMAGVTNALYKALETARQQDNSYLKVFEEVITRHKDTARALLPADKAEEFAAVIDKDADALQKILSTTWYGRVCSVEHSNLFVGFGELWSSLLLTLYLQSRPDEFPHAERVDAREIVVLQKRQVTNVDGIPRIDFERSGLQMAAWLKAHPSCQIAVITGFVCQTHDGIYSILGRNGSDFSCTIFGALLNAVKVTIWKDVEGVYTADPRFVPDAMKVDAMSYEEAIELSNFGGQVMHPLTMLPIMEKHIPVSIRSTFLPDSSGTVISRGHSRGMGLVKCFSNIDNLALVRVSSPSFSMETVEHLVVALARALVHVVQVGQSPFEHACQLIVYQRDAEVARETIERALNRGESAGDIQVALVAPVSIVAAIGDGIVTHQRTSAKFFSALYKAHVSVHAIAQSVSERSVCVVVDQPLAKRAVQALHAAFLQPLRTVAIGIMGPSVIASELCWQLAAQQRHLRETRGVNLQVRALLHVDVNTVPDPSAHLRQMHQNSQRRLRQSQRDGSDTETDEEDEFGFGSQANAPDMSASRLKMVKIPPTGVLPAAEWEGLLEKGVSATFDDFAKHVLEGHALHTVVVDCTTEPLGTLYGPWLSAGIDVITCNQRAVTLPHILSSLRRWEEGHLTKCMYDTCVGAGFTVVSTIRDLQLTGDSVIECDGVLSVTLSFVFNTFSPLWGTKDQPRPKFSEVVADAIKRKYVEQDMRDDFDGQYMARKLLILADASGLSITLDDIEVQSLVPASHSIANRPKATNAEVLAAMATSDGLMDDMLKQAEAKGEVLRYVGSFSLKTRKALVGIRSFPKTHPFASAQFTDQMLLLTTDRYSERPLLMVGPGETTVNCAASLLGDTIRLASLVADAQL